MFGGKTGDVGCTILVTALQEVLDSVGDLRGTITTLAEAEGLEAHAASVEQRFEDP